MPGTGEEILSLRGAGSPDPRHAGAPGAAEASSRDGGQLRRWRGMRGRRSPGWRRARPPARREIAPGETREWIRRKLLLRDFFNRRVAVFVEVKDDDVRRELARRSSVPRKRRGTDLGGGPGRDARRADRAGDPKLAIPRRIEIQADPFAHGGSMSPGLYALTVRTSFAAAHRLREYDGNCERLHGHNWQVEVTVESPTLDERGIALDFRILKDVASRPALPVRPPVPERSPAVRRDEPVVGESRAPLVRGNG